MVEKLHDAAYSPPRRAPKAPGWLRRGARAALGFVYPPLCPLCRDEVAETGGVCSACWTEITMIGGTTCSSCGAPMTPGAADQVAGKDGDLICDGCAHAPPAWSRGAAAVVYAGAGRRMILMLKHGDRLDLAPIAASWMLRAGAKLVASADVIAPVPLHWTRLAKRRFNQAGELAREIAAAAAKPDAARLDLLRRDRATTSMDGKSREERMETVLDVFSIADPAATRGRRVLLIDDVMTTGATLSACADVCRAAGAEDVNALVFARVARDDWPS